METNVLAKRVWNILRVALYMLRKGISKGKLIMDFNIVILKRHRKLAGKAISDLLNHHNHNHDTDTRLPQFSTTREYEFSCSNTPNNHFFSVISNSNKRNRRNNFFTRSHHAPSCAREDDAVTVTAVKAVMEMLNSEAAASPALPGFSRSPLVRQLRVTDSPFPVVGDADQDKDHQVDKAAEEFIKRFYKELRKQD